ncbi:NUDIX domain-containing protein [Ilyomonas limi]|uniref:GDP-mannose pyrophosphatase n=1 Tax=Ilyomonas limi TaxID=2575867 RepID=A0A4U3KTD4_9BACT|nr:NUDIX domain-containing protein [Ilyomonas limi]TKK65582.1 NUDIX domain-containing protein [Ilyomonas limi]
MPQVKIKHTTILSDEHYVLKRIDYELQQEEGKWKNQQREVFDHGNAVTALLYNKESKTVILTRQFRIATYVNGNEDGILTETCAGLIDTSESPEATIKREIKEETGYAVENVEKVYQAYTSAGSLTELLYLYVASYTEDQKAGGGGGLQKEGEDVQIMEIPFDDAVQMLEKGEIQDAKTIILLQYALLKSLI